MIDRFTDSFLAEIKAKVPISEVIGQTVTWDKEKTLPSRGDYWAPCPFHSESTPSFHCEDPKGVYHCFGCGESGDHFEFLTKNQGLSFPDAVERLAELAGVPLPDGRVEKLPQPRQERQEPVPEHDGPSDDALPLDDQPVAQLVPVKGYRYTDRDGNPIYEVIRKQWRLPDGSFVIDPKTGNPKKTFRQRHKGPDGAYIDNLDGIAHTIYRHPEVEQAIADGKTVHIVEGEKDVETLEALGFVGTTNSGGAGNWRPDLAEIFRGADVVIMVDNDDVGRKAGEVRAASLRGIASRIRILDFGAIIPGFPAKNDVSDWAAAGGTSAKLTEIIQSLSDWRPAPPVSRFNALGLDDLHNPHLRHEFLIDGFLDRRGVAMMPGASGSGKTFLVLEMSMCVALGREFFGMETKPGLVIYQAGEGKEGITKRLDGWMLDRGVEPSPTIPFRVLPKKVNLFVDDKDTDDLITESQAWSAYFGVPVRMVVIDTFNKAITGANENAGQDMTRVLARLERISETLDCAVVVPMHKGKNGDQRGHTSLTGDVSNVINVTELGNRENPFRDRNGRAIRTTSLDKNKDGESGRPMRFVLRQVVNGVDEKDKPITTCVVERPDGDDETLVAEGKLSAPQTIFLRVLKDAIEAEGIEAPITVIGVPYGKRVVAFKIFIERLRNKWPHVAAEHEIEKRNKEFERAVGDAGKRLVAYGYVERDNKEKLIWWTGKSDRPTPPRKVVVPVSAGMREAIDEGVPF